MLTSVLCRCGILASVALACSGCLTQIVWQRASDPVLSFDGLESRATAIDGRTALVARYAHEYEAPEACIVIPLDADGNAISPFGVSNSRFDELSKTAMDPFDPVARAVRTEGVSRPFHLASTEDYSSVAEQWSKDLNGEVVLAAYRIESPIQPAAKIESLLPETVNPLQESRPMVLPAGFHGVLIPRQRLRSPGKVFVARLGAAAVTPFTLAADGAIWVTSPIWVPILCVALKDVH